MKIGITKLIPENIAPSTAQSLAIYNGDTKVGTVDISEMQPQNLGDKLYSIGLISDTHLISSSTTASTNLGKALEFFDKQGVSFICCSGDTTNHGFWNSDGTKDLTQFAEYQRLCNLHTDMPIYTICGNHDSYFTPITETLTDLQTYTGYDLYYSVNHGNDVYIFIGQPTNITPMSDEALQWLYETLEATRNKRCFVFVHMYIDNADSGNPLGLYGNNGFLAWGTKKTAFINLLSHYKNTMVFHGHSHMKLEMQTKVETANYSTVLGFKSVHIPSTANYRNVVDEALTSGDGSYGYIADLYENHIVLKGYDFLTSECVPIAQYCIDTSLQTVEADTFTDNTGTIKTI